MPESTGPVLMVGLGLIGSAVTEHLRHAGTAVHTVARSGERGPEHLPCELDDPGGHRELREVLRASAPRCAVLTHGPSDVSWIEEHEEQAAAAHVRVPEVVAESGVPLVLVSTDNVFSGEQGRRRPGHEIRPANAYGRIKAAAERTVLAAGGLVLRVSLVYGWTGPRHRSTYGQRCLIAAGNGESLEAPTDQIFTPVHVRDVAEVVGATSRGGSPPTGVAHLSGPGELSRFDFARIAYRLAGADPDLVRPCLRKDTLWASRPRFSSLECDDFGHVDGLAGWRPMSPEEGLELMLRDRPVAAR